MKITKRKIKFHEIILIPRALSEFSINISEGTNGSPITIRDKRSLKNRGANCGLKLVKF